MRRAAAIFLAMAMAAAISACGNKAPLRLPESEFASAPAKII